MTSELSGAVKPTEGGGGSGDLSHERGLQLNYEFASMLRVIFRNRMKNNTFLCKLRRSGRDKQ